MFGSRTVFIIGAGASAEVGLPISTELSAIISQKLRYDDLSKERPSGGDQGIWGALHLIVNRAEVSDYTKAARVIADGLWSFRSIDDFLSTYKDNEKIAVCGKLAIARTICEQERGCALYAPPIGGEFLDAAQVDRSWLVRFARMLVADVARQDYDRVFQNVSFVIFNYDRCVEQFLRHALSKAFDIPFRDAAQLVTKLKVFRPYGSLGKLVIDGRGVAFGGSGLDELPQMGKIRTFHEQLADVEHLNEMRNEIVEAEKMVFLGFGFHAPNMKLLTLDSDKPLGAAKLVYATGLGRSTHDCSTISKDITSILRGNVRETPLVLSGIGCAQLFDDYSRSIIA